MRNLKTIKYLFIILITSVLLAILINIFFRQSKSTIKLIDAGSYASCFTKELQYENGMRVPVSDEIKKSLDCISGAVSLSPNNKLLSYDVVDLDNKTLSIKSHNFEKNQNQSQNLITIKTSEIGIDGIECKWNKNNVYLACIVIDQEQFDAFTKIFIFKLNGDGKLENVNEFEQNKENQADFMCGASCYPGDFWFEEPNILKYKGHKFLTPSDQVFSVSLN